MPVLPLAEVEALVAAAFRRADVGDGQARSVAAALVAAEAAGQAGHGLRRVEAYAAQARAGKVDGLAVPVAEATRPAVLRIDARNGFAFPAFDLAFAEVLARREMGVVVVAVRRSHHAGVLGLTVERFAEAGLVALMLANSPGAIAPWGGRTGLFGTNPVAFAAPVPGDDPLVVDLSLARVARGKVMAARQKGEAIPEGWALDADGRPTTDPAAALAGTMLPMAGAKGAALALVVELLAASLTGANTAAEASSLFDAEGPPPGLGQVILALDPAATGGPDALARVAQLVAAVAAEPGARLPGRRALALRRAAAEGGLAVDDALLAAIGRI